MEEKLKGQVICPYANMQQSCFPIARDEANLIDIWNVLWSKRLLILAVTILTTVLASAYAFNTPNVYETKVKITPPSDLGIGMLGVEIEAEGFGSKTVFNIFLKTLQNRTVQEEFWDESEIVKRLNLGNEFRLGNMSKAWFVRNLSVEKNMVTLSGSNPEELADVLNGFVSYVDDFSGRVVIDEMKLKLLEKKFVIEKNIELQRNIMKKRIQRQVDNLLEQKAIAEKLKIYEIPENFVGAPVYIRGVKALQAEIDIIRKRKNNDLDIVSLPEKQEELAAIDKVDWENVKISTMQAEMALVPRQPKPNKPKRQIIVVLGLVFGLIVGVFTAFFMNFVGNIRQSENRV